MGQPHPALEVGKNFWNTQLLCKTVETRVAKFGGMTQQGGQGQNVNMWTTLTLKGCTLLQHFVTMTDHKQASSTHSRRGLELRGYWMCTTPFCYVLVYMYI